MKWKTLCTAVALAVVSNLGHAQANYPDKAIKLIASAPPGGAYDFVARITGEGLRKHLGQPGIVENRAGAGGTIGATAAAQSDPDGYTLMVGSTGPMSVSPHLYSQIRYDAEKDFIPIARVVRMPSYLVVHPSVPANSVKELIDYAKANPGKLKYASTGNGLSQHTNVELFKSMTGTDIYAVTYKGSGPALIDFLAGRVDMMIELGPQAIPHIKAGKLKVLGTSTSTRTEAMPDVPPIAELGVPGFDAFTWFAIYAPKGTPQPVVDKLIDAVSKTFNDPETKARLADIGAEVALLPGQQLMDFQKAESEKWKAVIKHAGIQPQ